MKTMKVTVEQLQDIQQQLEDSIAHCRKMGKTLQATEKELEQVIRERDVLLEVLHENGIQVDLSVLKDIG